MTNKILTYLENLPRLLTPPLVGLLRSKWRDRNRSLPNIPDPHLYRPTFSPWLGQGAFGELRDTVAKFSLVSPDRLWVLYTAARNARRLPGDFVECGVYKGGTAHLLARVASTHVHLFDTFDGMPDVDISVDKHRKGDFADTSLEIVKHNVGKSEIVSYHPGFIPSTFANAGLGQISLLHVDCDLHDSILSTLEYCYKRVVTGGYVVFDDYGFASCYGAREAVDAFFSDRAETPISLPTGQAVVVKLPGAGS